ncbi:hypothetical protein DSECCO2_503660 [anaerobic digester metagenome]|jgi:hypothetical protein
MTAKNLKYLSTNYNSFTYTINVEYIYDCYAHFQHFYSRLQTVEARQKKQTYRHGYAPLIKFCCFFHDILNVSAIEELQISVPLAKIID